MAYAQLMNVVDAGYELLEVLACLAFFQSLVLHDQVEELATLDKLHHKIQILLSLNNLINLHNIRMVQLFQNLYLPAYPLYVFLFLDP